MTDDDLLTPPMTSAKRRQIELKLVKMAREWAKGGGKDDLANMSSEDLLEALNQVAREHGYEPNKPHN